MIQKLLARTLFFAFLCCRFLQRINQSIERLFSGFAMAVLEHSGHNYFTALVYDQKKTVYTELFDWEAKWFDYDLPDPPAKLLVGGAGKGREIKELLARGYEIVAFDPAVDCIDEAKNIFQDNNSVVFHTGSYEDLLNKEGKELRKSIEDPQPYDGVLLGWGRFTHVFGEKMRIGILEYLRGVCPQGPILLSYWDGNIMLNKGRMWRLGNALGKPIRILQGIKTEYSARDDISLFAGYAHVFNTEEIKKIVCQSGNKMKVNPAINYTASYHHITLLPEESEEQ